MFKDYTKVNIFLPLTPKSVPQIRKIIIELREQFKGLTISRTNKPTPFIGYFIDDNGNLWVDQVICFYIDIDAEDEIDLEKYFLDFKEKYEKELGECKIWIIVYAVSRIIPDQGESNKCKKDDIVSI